MIPQEAPQRKGWRAICAVDPSPRPVGVTPQAGGEDPVQSEARHLIACGFAVTFLTPGEKSPCRRGWMLKSQSPAAYEPGQNVGIITGRLSGDLVCADIDDALALKA